MRKLTAVLTALCFFCMSFPAMAQNYGASPALWISAVGSPTLTCSATSYNGTFYTEKTSAAVFQCTNATGSYAWNAVGGGGGAPGGVAGQGQINSGSSTFAAEKNSYVFQAGVNGAACDDSTDDTTPLNTLLGTVYTNGGGTIRVHGTCLISGQISVPNNAAGTNPRQPGIRITGDMSSAMGYWLSLPASPSTLDMRYNATYGKILTLGFGVLEIDHLLLEDGGSDCATFVYTTNTTLSLHDNAFSGTASGTSACNGAVRLGGTTTTAQTLTPTDSFGGYGSYVQHNFFDQIGTGVYLGVYGQAVTVKDNTWSASCGGTSSIPAVMIGTGTGTADGNIFSGNLYETANYPYVIWVKSNGNLFLGETFWDASVTTLYGFHFTNSASKNVALVYHDSDMTAANLTDNNQPAGVNAVVDQAWQVAQALSGIQGQLCADSSGSATAQVCSTGVSFTPQTGTWITYKPGLSNSGAGLTINVNGLGAKSVAEWQTSTTLTAGDVQAGATIPMFYDGTNWEMIGIGNPPSGSSGVGEIIPGTNISCTPLSGGHCVGNVTVNSTGGGGSGAWTNITGSVTVSGCTVASGACAVSGGATTAVTFSSIPGTYNQLQIIAWGQSGTQSNVAMTFNGDTAAHYSQAGYYQQGTGGVFQDYTSSASNCVPGALPSTGSGEMIVDIPFYANTSFDKASTAHAGSFASVSSSANIDVGTSCLWNQTTAITSVTLTLSSGAYDYAAGTEFMILGQN